MGGSLSGYIIVTQSRFQFKEHCQVFLKGCFQMKTESIHQEVITILHVYVLNNRVSKDKKQKLIELQGEMIKSIIIVRD